MQDEGGGDEKIIAVPSRKTTLRYDKVPTTPICREITVQQIEHFFGHYKDLEPGKWAKIDHLGDSGEARRLITEAIERAKKSNR